VNEAFPQTKLQAKEGESFAPATITPHDNIPPPLCVDLDGTLLKTDMLLEAAFALLKTNPFFLFLLPIWLLKGKAYLKQQIARRVTLDVACLPYNLEFLKFLTEEYQNGRPLILTTACDVKLARQISQHLGIFTGVLASDGKTNLSGAKKLQMLREKFGGKAFDYAGNAAIDLPIWQNANASIVVNAPARVVKKAGQTASLSKIFPREQDAKSRLRVFLKAIRVHQWVKNILIFVPLLTAHKLAEPALLVNAFYAFIAFSLCSSSVYLLNDLLDLEADRLHPTKRQRPFASGDLPLLTGIFLVPVFLLASTAISVLLPPGFLYALMAYFSLTLAYSLYLKQVVLVDVLLLALLYTARLIAGAAAVAVTVSPWLFAFSLFLFLSLAFVKRYSELRSLRLANKEAAKGRGYLANDLEQLSSLGAASGYISVLVLALYIHSYDVAALYRHPEALWLICLLLLYWISRVWLLAHRGGMHQDPIVFALKDKVSYLLGALAGVVMVAAA